MKRIVLFLAASACFWLACCGQEGCSEDLYSNVLGCFSKNDLELAIDGQQQDTQTILEEAKAMNPVISCQHEDNYKKAIVCSMSAIKPCLEKVSAAGFMPDLERLQEGVSVMCSKIDQFDGDCFKREYPKILTCARNTVEQLFKDGALKTDNMDDAICVSIDINYDCTKHHLQVCPKSTTDIYLEQMDKYSLPVACEGRNPSRRSRQLYSAERYTSASGFPWVMSVTGWLATLSVHWLL